MIDINTQQLNNITIIFVSLCFSDCCIESYSTLGNNGILTASPVVLHFAEFEVGKVHCLKLDVVNSSADVQQMHIIPPQTKYFRIHYMKNVRQVCFIIFAI